MPTYDAIFRGDTVTWDWAFTTSDGQAYDLTDCTIWYTLKISDQDADADALIKHYWVDGGASSGITVDDQTTGEVVHVVSAAESLALAIRPHRYDVQLQDADGNITTLASGQLIVKRDVTVRTTTP